MTIYTCMYICIEREREGDVIYIYIYVHTPYCTGSDGDATGQWGLAKIFGIGVSSLNPYVRCLKPRHTQKQQQTVLHKSNNKPFSPQAFVFTSNELFNVDMRIRDIFANPQARPWRDWARGD